MKNIIINVLLLLIIISCNSKEYKNNSIGLKITLPENIILREKKILSSEWDELLKAWNKKYVLRVYDVPIKDNDIFIRRFPNITQEGILEKFKKGENKIFYTDGIKKSYQYFRKDNLIIGEKYFYMKTAPQYSDSDFIVPASQTYYIELCLVKNNQLIYIRLSYYDSNLNIPFEYPEFFKKDGNSWVCKDKTKPDKIYDLIIQKSEKAPKELVKLFEYFDEIEKSIVLE